MSGGGQGKGGKGGREGGEERKPPQHGTRLFHFLGQVHLGSIFQSIKDK